MRPPPFPADLSEGLVGRSKAGADPLAALDDVPWADLDGAYDGGASAPPVLVTGVARTLRQPQPGLTTP